MLKKWFLKYKKGLIIGFFLGAFVFPFLAVLGLISSFFEMLRPLLIGPLDFVKVFIPDVQIGPNSFYVPVYKWVLTLGFNGVCYAFVGALIQFLFRKK